MSTRASLWDRVQDECCCDEGVDLAEFKTQARTHWYSKTPEIKLPDEFAKDSALHREWRSRDGTRWFSIVLPNRPGVSNFAEMTPGRRSEPPIVHEVVIQRRPTDLVDTRARRQHDAILERKPVSLDDEFPRGIKFLGETYTYEKRSREHLHRCADGTVKVLTLDPSGSQSTEWLPRSKLHYGTLLVQVYLPERRKEIPDQDDDEQVRAVLWEGFARDEHSRKRVASEQLRDLVTSSYGLSLPHLRPAGGNFYEYGRDSGRYFQVWTTEIWEFKPKTKAEVRVPEHDDHRTQASISHPILGFRQSVLYRV